MSTIIKSIPKPLVTTNQWVIVLSVLTSWIFQNGWFLWIPLLSGLIGLITGFNPILKLSRLFLRKPLSTYIPEDIEQQKFNQKMAVICLSLGWLGFVTGLMWMAYLFTIMVFLSAFIAILGFCIGCFIRFRWQQYQYRRKTRLS
jgi:uncharacterized membrane protein SpoIIM required for sporulation